MGADVPLIDYVGSGLTQAYYLHADHQGSIVALSGAANSGDTIPNSPTSAWARDPLGRLISMAGVAAQEKGRPSRKKRPASELVLTDKPWRISNTPPASAMEAPNPLG
jgi:hypothetical protein